MPLVTMKEILVPAREQKYGVGAFEFWSLDSAQAVVEAAAEQNMPVILQVGELECDYAGGIKNIYKLAKTVADEYPIPVALHLDHAEKFDFVLSAIDAGFTSVMIDASAKPFEENVALTRKVVEAAKPYGITVESELGRLIGNEGSISVDDAQAAQTDPEDARRFVEETGIDALAVAIGTVHGFYNFEPKINIDRLKEIAAAVSIPLVLHGGSGTPDEKVQQAIANGIAKVNICTEFVAAYGKQYTATQAQEGFKYSIPSLFGPSKAAGKALAAAKIKLFSLK